MKCMEKLDPPLVPSTSIAEKAKRDRDRRERGEETDDEDMEIGEDCAPSDSLSEAFGF